jgi:hypothetical protein
MLQSPSEKMRDGDAVMVAKVLRCRGDCKFVLSNVLDLGEYDI